MTSSRIDPSAPAKLPGKGGRDVLASEIMELLGRGGCLAPETPEEWRRGSASLEECVARTVPPPLDLSRARRTRAVETGELLRLLREIVGREMRKGPGPARGKSASAGEVARILAQAWRSSNGISVVGLAKRLGVSLRTLRAFLHHEPLATETLRRIVESVHLVCVGLESGAEALGVQNAPPAFRRSSRESHTVREALKSTRPAASPVRVRGEAHPPGVQRSVPLGSMSLAKKWMSVTKFSSAALARRVGVPVSELLLFLDPEKESGLEERVSRVIQHGVEEVCADHGNIYDVEVETDARASEDEASWARNHYWRLIALRKNLDGPQALSLSGELVAQALQGPRPYRVLMASNALVSLATVLSREGDRVSRGLLRCTVNRVMQLERSGMRGPTNRNLRIFREQIRGQAGFCLVHAGLALKQTRLVRTGVERLLRQVVRPGHYTSAWAWHNFIVVLDDLLEYGHPGARDWALAGARNGKPLGLRRAWEERDCRLLGGLWKAELPAFLEGLSAGRISR